MSARIKIIGKDGQGWSIDKDRFNTEKALNELNFKIVKSVFNADIIFNVWYSYILKLKFWPIRIFKGNKKIVVALTNDPEDNHIDMQKYNKFVDYWICANFKQKKFLLRQNINHTRIFINPFFVDDQIFRQLQFSKKDIAMQLSVDYEAIKEKFIIGSFQRDSKGGDLSRSKWHKNPEMIIDILKKINKSRFLLLLAGPRRHFLINQCRKNKIPYLFVGNEALIDELIDDVSENNLSQEKVNLLYNLTDLYLLTSASEGGPKAVIEASLTKTAILSTPVGFSPDLLDEYSICQSETDFINKTVKFIDDADILAETIQRNFEKVKQINNFNAYKQRIKTIIETISNDR